MTMTIEILESFTDYSGINTGACPMSVEWLLSSASNLALVTSSGEGGRSFQLNDTTGSVGNVLHMFAAPVTKVTMAWRFTITDMWPMVSNPMFEMIDAVGAIQWSLQVTELGKMVILGEGGAVVATSHTNFTSETIYACCLHVDYVGANNANVGVSINGFVDPGLNLTGIDMQDQSSVSMAGLRFQRGNASAAFDLGIWELHDLIVGTGEAVDWGPLEVADFTPNTDLVSDWTPLSGTDNWAMVDEAQADGDTTYNSTETLNAKDIYGFGDGETPESILCVALVGWHKKEDSAARRFRHVLRVGGNDYNGAEIFCAESYDRSFTVWMQNPDTAADWDPSELADVAGGYEYLGV